MAAGKAQVLRSPDYMRISLAAAMTLGYEPGLFFRGARLYCINLLLTYPDGCRGRCAYCGLSAQGPAAGRGERFIRVQWPAYPLADIIHRISGRREAVRRICISMITHRQAKAGTVAACTRLRSSLDIPVSLLIAPTLLGNGDLERFKAAGADKVGVAVDLATPALFDRYRGSGVKGPHRWAAYWQCFQRAVEVFGVGHAGVHLMAGMGETEKEMCEAIQRARDMGGRTHLFSFFPEQGSRMAAHPRPSIVHYRHIQFARYLIDHGIAGAGQFAFDNQGRIMDFGLSAADQDGLIRSGEPFRTSGCEGYDGEVACNRPFANSRPGPHLRNYPFPPDAEDLYRIRLQLGGRAGRVGDRKRSLDKLPDG
jgi:biotin synthase-related radical SAM superfamily protein